MHRMTFLLVWLVAIAVLNAVLCEQSPWPNLQHTNEGNALRFQLGIPPNAKGVIMFGQASHLDWDWNQWFSQYANDTPPGAGWNPNLAESPQPTDRIFAMASTMLAANPSTYGYNVCEMGFFRRFSQDNPGSFNAMKQFNPAQFSIVGGGITSPDNLLPHGEGFLRNYLSGYQWLSSEGLQWSGTAWLPDDFGHDSQLPVLMDALGIRGIGFARLPDGCKDLKLARNVLLNRSFGGINFNWHASDASTVVAYYIPQYYCCADGIYNAPQECFPNSPEDLIKCRCSVKVNNSFDRILTWYNVRQPVSPTPYVYVEIGCDFAMPRPNLAALLDKWNTEQYPKMGLWALSSAFDKYFALYQDAMRATNKTLRDRHFHGANPTSAFQPTPYWTGYYSSRPALKQGHYATVRNLLAAETFSALGRAQGLGSAVPHQSDLDAEWMDVAPTTHHDFLTGTSHDYTYYGEQLPWTQRIVASSTSTLSSTLAALTQHITGNTTGQVVAYNANGFAVSNIVSEVDLSALSLEERKEFIASVGVDRVQLSSASDRKGLQSVVAQLSAPSLGYQTQTPSKLNEGNDVRVTVSPDANTVTLENSRLTAVISADSNWAITSLVDKGGSKKNIFSKNGGNVFQFRFDGGNIYRYGYEENGCIFALYKTKITPLAAQILEQGPLRTTVRVGFVVTATFNKTYVAGPQTYVIEYALAKDEPLLRVNVTGAAFVIPSAVITAFDFPEAIANYSHGTTYHWDWKQPNLWGHQPDFQATMEATHDFVAVRNSRSGAQSAWQGAVLHGDTPSWGVQGSTLYGVLLRNSPGNIKGCGGYGSDGTDNATHSVRFAVRVPSSFSIDTVRQEAALLHTPLVALPVPSSPVAPVIASTKAFASSKDPFVSVTVGKGGTMDPDSLIVRIYNPRNRRFTTTIVLDPTLVSTNTVVTRVSAVEVPLSDQTGVGKIAANHSVQVELRNALTTLKFKG